MKPSKKLKATVVVMQPNGLEDFPRIFWKCLANVGLAAHQQYEH
jgi:hypothetical protein